MYKLVKICNFGKKTQYKYSPFLRSSAIYATVLLQNPRFLPKEVPGTVLYCMSACACSIHFVWGRFPCIMYGRQRGLYCVPTAYMSPLFLLAGGGGWVYRVVHAYTGVGNHTNGHSIIIGPCADITRPTGPTHTVLKCFGHVLGTCWARHPGADKINQAQFTFKLICNYLK